MDKFIVVTIADDDFTKINIVSIGDSYIQAASAISSMLYMLEEKYGDVKVEDQVPLYVTPGDFRSFIGLMTKTTYKLEEEDHTVRYYILLCTDFEHSNPFNYVPQPSYNPFNDPVVHKMINDDLKANRDKEKKGEE